MAYTGIDFLLKGIAEDSSLSLITDIYHGSNFVVNADTLGCDGDDHRHRR